MASDRNFFQAAMACTEIHRTMLGENRADAEIAFLRAYLPLTQHEIEEGDLFAGHMHHDDFVLQVNLHGYGQGMPQQSAYCYNRSRLLEIGRRLGPEYADRIAGIDAYWMEHATVYQDAKRFADYPEKPQVGLDHVVTGRGIRVAGVYLDFDRLTSLGIGGLRDLLVEKAATSSPGSRSYYSASLAALDLFRDCAVDYAAQARQGAREAGPERAAELVRMADALDWIATERPSGFYQAVQLFWLYACLACIEGYGRMDVYLGDFLVTDLDAGRLTDEDAVTLLVSLWKRIETDVVNADGRILLGGMGRRNAANADRFALCAMEATRRARGVIPALTLRLHEGLDPRLLDKALSVVGEGCLYPMLYNDERYVDGVGTLLDVRRAEAMAYSPLGCGEICLDHRSIGSPNSAFLVPKALEAAIRKSYPNRTDAGPDGLVKDGDATFRGLLDAFEAEVVRAARIAARLAVYNYQSMEGEAVFLLASMLFDDCLERGKGLLEGGARYKGACTEGFGFTNVADSLLVLRKTVFEDEILSLEEVGRILEADFEDHDEVRRRFLSVAKFGNDDPEADRMTAYVNDFVSRAVHDAGVEAGLDYFIVSSVNPGGIEFGPYCAASADGRKNGETLAVGYAPTAGNDRSGLTAMLNSVATANPVNGGYITNLKLSTEMFLEHLEELKALLGVFFRKGGLELNISVIDRGALEDALVNPERYPNLMVRVGGWAARFVDLPPIYQNEIIQRTGY
jgi:pyruvate-formate lyase